MENNYCKKYRLVTRTLNEASAEYISVDANDDVEPGVLINYKYSDIIRLENGNEILDILGSLEVGCV